MWFKLLKAWLLVRCTSDSEKKRGYQSRWMGLRGECLATRYLKKHGYKICARNWHWKHGEIDIIAQKQNLYAFVEVRGRDIKQLCSGYYSISKHKKSVLKTTIKAYLKRHTEISHYRFDIISIEWDKSDIKHLYHYENIPLTF